MTHLGLQHRPAVAPLVVVGAMHDDPLSRIESFSDVSLRGSLASSGGMRDKPGTLQTGQGMLHEGGGCPVNRGREKGRKCPPPFACAKMEVGRAASPHWPELGHLQGSTCQACQVRSSGNMPVSSDMRSGPVKRSGVVGPCCEPKEESSWTTPSTRKGVAGPWFSKNQREAGQARQANQAASTRNSRGFDAQTRVKAG